MTPNFVPPATALVAFLAATSAALDGAFLGPSFFWGLGCWAMGCATMWFLVVVPAMTMEIT